jgi:UDP-2,3-diacylglucosamine hydrolase
MSAAEESRVTPLGIIAGSGMLPRALADKCAGLGRGSAVVALQGFAKVDDFAPYLRTALSIGRGRSMIRFFHEHGVREICLIGAVRRPSLWDVRPDFWTLSRVGPILLRGGLGDDGLLKAVRAIFENEGFTIKGIQDFLPELIATTGTLGTHQPDENHQRDILRGYHVARALGMVDVGQAVVVQGGIVLGVEGAEGTAELIRRCGALKRNGPGPILIKLAKPNQDRALDLPTIGPDTIAQVIHAGFSGIVVESGKTLMTDPSAMLSLADPAGLFILGTTEPF